MNASSSIGMRVFPLGIEPQGGQLNKIRSTLLAVVLSAAWAAPISPQVALAQTDAPPASDPAFTPITVYLPIVVTQGDREKTNPAAPAEHDHFAQNHSHDDYTMAEAARARQELPFQIDSTRQALATAPADRQRLGDWGAVFTWPFTFGSAANLPDGRIIAWGANNTTSFTGGNFTYSSIWDPATNTLTSRNNANHSMFCGIPTLQEDGRVIVNGGDGDNAHTSSFDYRSSAWTRLDEMTTGRWYPGSAVLPSGKIFTMLGRPGGSYPEVWTQGQGWSLLTGANLNSGVLNFTGYQSTWLPYVYLAPNGQIFHMGPTTQMNWINPAGNGGISSASLNNTWYPKYSGSILYDEGKILSAGGAASSADTAPGTNQAMLIDLNGANPTKTVIAPMANARKFDNAVILPTGDVMIIGGSTVGTEFSDSGTILTPEIWNPDIQTWRAVADHSVPRNYHSVALLMTDGRVWSGGGGICACAGDHPDHQVYSPGYLYNADGSLTTRPTISTAPTTISYGRTFNVQATSGITRFSFIKMSGVTHNLNSDLRQLKLAFTSPSSGQYAVTVPSNPNVLTPGFWMLFAVNSAGVPSVAKVIQVVSTNAPVLTNPGTQGSLINATINVQIAASDPNGDTLTYSATGLPSGLNINSATGLINGTANATGNYRPTVSVSDGTNTVSATFDWSVTQPGSIRYVRLEALSESVGNPWTSAAEINVLDTGNTALIRAGWTATADSQEASDGSPALAIDGNTGTVWHTQWRTANPVPPHWIVIDMKTSLTVGGFTYLPRQDGVVNGRIANYRFYISADGLTWGNPVAQGTFANDATEKTVFLNPNRAPTLAQPTNQSSTVNTAATLALSANDPDGDTLTYSASGLPVGMSINAATGVINGTPTTVNTYNVSVSVQDVRGGSDTKNFTWAINAPGLVLNALTSAPKQINTSVSYTASSSNGLNPRYKWLWGDDTAETAYSPTATASHSFVSPGLYTVKLTATDDRGVEQSTTFVQAIYLPSTANRAVTSMNIAYETRSGSNNRVWVVNQDNDSVSVFDAVTHGKLAEIAVGTAPRSLAIAPDGRVWVTNKHSANISIISPSTLAVAQTINLPYGSQPFGVAFAPTGGVGYVALEGAGQLLRFDATTATQTGSVAIGPNVRHLAINSDGSHVYLSRFITPHVPGEETGAPQLSNGQGEVLVVNASDLSLIKTLGLSPSAKPDTETAGRGIPNYVGGMALSPDGTSAWVPSKLDNIVRGTLRDGNNLNFQNTVRAINSRIDLSTENEDTTGRIDHDNAGMPSAAIFDRYGVYLFVALETNREIAVVDAYGRRELFRVAVGRAPQGLALSADGLRLYVQNFMDRSISVLDLSQLINAGRSTISVINTYNSVSTDKLSAQVLNGKQLFYDAKDTRLARDSYISCAACHNDGGHDGRVWDLTGMGEGLRNTIALQGRTGAQGFLHWSGNFNEVQDFEGQIRELSGGTGLMTDAQFNTGTRNQPLGDNKAGVSADLDALAAYVSSLNKFPNSPNRNSDGSLTADAVTGRDVFRSANCGQCHGGSAFTNSGAATLFNVGTLKPSSGQRLGGTLTGIDPPTLRDVWATAPYLHDGSAATLTEAVNAHNNVTIAPVDLPKLVAYLQQIDPQEISAPTNLGSGQILREWWTGVSGGTVQLLTSATAYPYAPTGNNMLATFEAPTNWADNYGTRVRGYVHAPVSGQYRFWIAGDDYSELRLSSGANPANAQFIASVPGYTGVREWTKYAQQKSALITLVAGQKYYIEALQKEGGGGDNLAVGWEVPGQALAIVDGIYLSPYVRPTVSNVARGKSATQSSTYPSAVASRAIDGNTNGTYSAGTSSSTNSTTNAWWQVDLGATYTLDSIQLWNRTDCCANRLSNFYVFVSNTNISGRSFSSLVNDSTVWRYYSNGQAPNKLDIPVYISGRYVRVQLAGTNYLTLPEVQVYGR